MNLPYVGLIESWVRLDGSKRPHLILSLISPERGMPLHLKLPVPKKEHSCFREGFDFLVEVSDVTSNTIELSHDAA